MALGFVCAIRFGGGASKAVAAAAQQSALSVRAMPGVRRAAVAL